MNLTVLSPEQAHDLMMQLKPSWTRSKLSKFIYKNKESRKTPERLMRDIFTPGSSLPEEMFGNICNSEGVSERVAFGWMMHDVLAAFKG